MIKAIIFDCFGVVRVDATNNAYKLLGGDDQADEEFIRDTMLKANAGHISNGAALIADRLGISEEKWRKTVKTSSVIDYGVLDYVKSLRRKYKTGMLSNIGEGGLKAWFGPGELDKYFDVAIGSGDIGFAKPEPEAYEIAADRLAVRLDECVFIDDKQDLCEGARGVGMQAIQYIDLKQLKRDLNKILADSAAANN